MQPTDIPWQEPWHSLEDEPNTQAMHGRELARELAKGHVLEGRQFQAIGRHVGQDDILFVLDGGGPTLAVVHLTYSPTREKDREWPWTEIYRDAQEFVEKRMRVDAEEYSAE